ncbi:hypothetical protein ACWDF6_30340, partial [Streptomyces sp. NPDC001155]
RSKFGHRASPLWEAVACAVCACAVGTGVAMTYDAPALLHAVGHRLDPDHLAPGHGHAPEGHHS